MCTCGIDESREDIFPLRIDDFRAGGGGAEILVDARDRFAVAVDVGDVPGVGRYNFTVFD